MEPAVISVFTFKELDFKGNPAAVFLCDKILDTEDMQQKANVIGLPATSFVSIDEEGRCNVRWFAPDAEIHLCGHGAAAAGIFLSDHLNKKDIMLCYDGGEIIVTVEEDIFHMSLKAIPIIRELPECPKAIREGLGIPVVAIYETANKHLILTDSANAVKQMKPDFDRLKESEIFGYAVTALGDEVDFVSRTLVPHVNQLEDFATGSSHAMLVPFWASRLKKNELVANQLSERGGRFYTKISGEEVTLSGHFEKLS